MNLPAEAGIYKEKDGHTAEKAVLAILSVIE